MSLVGDKCDKCRHCMRVYDNDHDRTQWVCTISKETVKPLGGPCDNYWGPEVPRPPYVAEMSFGKPLGLLTEMHLLEEFAVLLARLERLLLALELQPRVDRPEGPWRHLHR